MLLFLKALFDVYISIVYWNKSIQTMGSLCLWQCLLVPTACTSTQGFRTQTLFAPNLFQLVPIWSNLSRQCSLQPESNDSELRLKSQFLVQSRWLLAPCFLRGINWRAAAKIAPHCNFLSLFHFQLVPNRSSVILRKYSLALQSAVSGFSQHLRETVKNVLADYAR